MFPAVASGSGCVLLGLWASPGVSAGGLAVLNKGPHGRRSALAAVFQARLCNNMQKARELWDHIMTKGNAKYANMWLEYYNLER